MRIAAAGRAAGLVFVVLNNHFLGQAAVAALELKAAFAGAPVAVPPALLRNYPQLGAIAAPPPDGAQGELF